MKLWILSAVLFALVGCQQTPTRVYESQPVQVKEGTAEIKDIRFTSKTIFIDARSPFEYSLSHLNGSMNVRPEEFTQKELPYLGVLETDRFALTRWLARKGISPDSAVVVVGKGLSGKGEEGRVAWNLKLLGVKDVQFASIEHFSLPMSNAEAPPREPVTLWKPEGDDTLEVVRADFLAVVHSPKTNPSSALILDVRSEDEYLGKVKVFEKEVPDVGGMNIPWTEFFDAQGLVKTSVKDRLAAVGVQTDRRLLVISNQGVESAAVTLALRKLGYNRATNFAGGYQELVFAGKPAKKPSPKKRK